MPNGSKIEKGNMNLISIFNPSDNFPREKLPGNLINNSFYFIVESPNENDIQNILLNIFLEEENLSKEEAKEFTTNFLKAKEIAKDSGEYPFTL